MRAPRSLLLWLGIAAALGLAVYAFAGRAVPPVAAATEPAPPGAAARETAEQPRATAQPPPAPPVRGISPARPDQAAFAEMRALVDEQRIGDARVRAERFFAEYPDSPYGERVERLTGVHPHAPPPGARGR